MLFSKSNHYWATLPEAKIFAFGAILAAYIAGGQLLLSACSILAILVLTLISVVYRCQEKANENWQKLSLLLCVLLIVFLAHQWRQLDGWIFTRDFGESFSVYLAAFNARDWITFILQDMSTAPEDAGHPFLYTHQPSFIARLGSMFIQALGGGIPENMLFNFLVLTIFLFWCANALSKLISWPVAAGAVFFCVTSYTLFHENIVDLTRAQGYFSLFGGLIVLARDPSVVKLRSKILLAICVMAAAASDFVICLFVTYTLLGIYIWLNQEVNLKRIFTYFVAPGAAFYLVYFGTVVVAKGWDFFYVDALYTYFGRAGQVVPDSRTYKNIPGLPSIMDMPDFYQNHDVVLWARDVKKFTVRDLWESLQISWKAQATGGLSRIMFWIVAGCIFFLGCLSKRGIALLASMTALLVYAISTKASPKLVLIYFLVPAVVFLFLLPSFKCERYRWSSAFLRFLGGAQVANSIAFITIAAMGLVVVASIFPEYGIRFIIQQRRGVPGPLLEMLTFGLIVFLGFRLISSAKIIKYEYPRFSVLAHPVAFMGWGIIFVSCVAVCQKNIQTYKKTPPKTVLYAQELSREKYQGASFVTSSFYGQPWYFTRGWAYMAPAAPLKKFHEYKYLRHVSDWANVKKYGAPDYFFCDNTSLKGYPVDVVPASDCDGGEGPVVCTCKDVSRYMKALGYTPEFDSDAYSIINVRNKNGILH